MDSKYNATRWNVWRNRALAAEAKALKPDAFRCCNCETALDALTVRWNVWRNRALAAEGRIQDAFRVSHAQGIDSPALQAERNHLDTRLQAPSECARCEELEADVLAKSQRIDALLDSRDLHRTARDMLEGQLRGYRQRNRQGEEGPGIAAQVLPTGRPQVCCDMDWD